MLDRQNFNWDTYWWTATNQDLPFLSKPISITIYSHCERQGTSPDQSVPPSDRQLVIANSLFELPVNLADSMHHVAEASRAETDEAVGLADEGLGHINRDNIHLFYKIDSILIPQDCSDDESVVFLDGECAWEEEHGLRISMRDGTLVGYSWQSGGISVENIVENLDQS